MSAAGQPGAAPGADGAGGADRVDGAGAAEWAHGHRFTAVDAAAERGTRWVVAITLVTMVAEIGAGWWYGSMALLADGWHMGSHAIGIGLAAWIYATARRHASDTRYAFGPWKLEVLGGFASALLLLGVALLMVVGSVERLWEPQAIAYREAVVVAVLGLLVNLVCAVILHRAHGPGQGHHGHGHGHAHGHGHGHGHAHRSEGDEHGHHGRADGAGDGHGRRGDDDADDHRHHGDPGRAPGHGAGSPGAAAPDLNLRAAYLHVVTDAATSVLAIVALLAGWRLGWAWMDPAMGLVGAVLIARWSRGLLAETSRVLLDREMDDPVTAAIRGAVQGHGAGTVVADLHAWRVGPRAWACALTVVSDDAALTAAAVRRRLAAADTGVAHATVEVHHRSAATAAAPGSSAERPA